MQSFRLRTCFGSCLSAALLVVSLSSAVAQSQAPQSEDLAALRYFVSIGDTRAAELERRRLKAAFPDAVLPDVTADSDAGDAGGVDTSAVWTMIEANDFAGARAAISRLSANNPGWQPDANLMDVLSAREGQIGLESAFERRDADAVGALLSSVPSLASCSRVNNTWRYAELLAASGKRDAAGEVYARVAASCPGQETVIASLQKMSAIASPETLAKAFERAFAATPANAAALRAEAASLLPARLATPFRQDVGGEPPTITLSDPAAPPATTPAPASTSSSGTRLAAMVARKDWQGCVRATQGVSASAPLLQRSWCLLNISRPREARVGFSTVASRGGSLAAEARYGQALAHLKLGQINEAAAISQQGGLRSSWKREIDSAILQARAFQAYEARRYSNAIELFEALQANSGSLSPSLSMIYGWALWNGGRKVEAQRHFTRLHNAHPSADTRQALSVVMN